RFQRRRRRARRPHGRHGSGRTLMSTLDVIVATIGRAHGLRGEVALTLRTDQPEERLQPGTAFTVTQDGRERTLTVARTRLQQDRWYATFEEVADRTDAESLRGIDLELAVEDRKSTRLNSSHVKISYAVFCLKKK